MGYYIEVPGSHGKAGQILNGKVMVQVTGDPGDGFTKFDPATKWEFAPEYRALEIPCPTSLADIPPDSALIVVADNGWMEAAGYAYDESAFAAFTDPSDTRPRRYILIDRDLADRASGLKRS